MISEVDWIYIGLPIEYESEKLTAFEKIVAVVIAKDIDAIIIANINILHEIMFIHIKLISCSREIKIEMKNDSCIDFKNQRKKNRK